MQNNTYARVLRSVDAATGSERIQKILREVFDSQAMLVVVEQPRPASNTAVFTLTETLRGCDSLHFYR